MPRSDGQPDFTEAANLLDLLTGDGGWEAMGTGAHFDIRHVNGKTIYSMPVVVSADMLMILKWHDLTKEDVRVLSQKAV